MWLRLLPGLALLVLGCAGPDSSPSASSGPSGAEPSTPPAEQPAAFFTSVTEYAGLGDFEHVRGEFGEKWFPEIMGSGGGFLDYDGDGWLDVVLVGGGSLPSRPIREVPAISIYRNQGDGTYRNVTEEVGLADVRAYGMGVTAADYDEDGDPDLLLTTLNENLLFRNDGGTFQEVGGEAGIGERSRWSTSATFFDADRDGDLDLYVANYVRWSPQTDVECVNRAGPDYCNPRHYEGIADTYYRNDGDGTFTDATSEAGFLDGIDPVASKGLGVAELDYDQDGWSDLYVANDGGRNYLFHNEGDGTFTETALRSGVALDRRGSPRAGMGVDVGVVDSTGEISIFVGNFSQESVSVWRHQRRGFFDDRATVSGIGFPTQRTLTFGLGLIDVDLDTDLNLLLANGNVIEQIATLHEGVTFRERAQLFLNRGDGTFAEANPGRGPLTEPMLARGLAYGDYDRDGDQDVLITENGGPAHLWRNDRGGEGFLRVELEGTESSQDAIGARVLATVDGLTMERRVRGGTSYLSQSEKTLTFGLGGSRAVDTLTVEWPSGRTDRFQDVSPDQTVRLVEGADALEPLAKPDTGAGPEDEELVQR